MFVYSQKEINTELKHKYVCEHRCTHTPKSNICMCVCVCVCVCVGGGGVMRPPCTDARGSTKVVVFILDTLAAPNRSGFG
jgi:hypothetical protein